MPDTPHTGMTDQQVALYLGAVLIFSRRGGDPAESLRKARALLDLVLETPEQPFKGTEK
jgi:hypothetical protein